MIDPERIARVANLRADEVKYLTKDGENHPNSRSCCLHLDVFHSEGALAGGGRWRRCLVSPCPCRKEDKSLWEYPKPTRWDRAEPWVMTFIGGMTFTILGALFLAWLQR